MKKLYLLLAILSIMLLSGCGLNDAKYISITDKTSDDYYTKELYSKLLSGNEYSIVVFDTNLYKDIKVDDTDKYVVEEFFKSLSKENFNTSTTYPQEKEPYRIIITFDDIKYQIKVYSADNVFLAPWDGKFKPDNINFKNVPQRYNLFDFCEYIKKSHS
ncbi:MAG: DUF4883 family protein [Clostridium sp.]